MDDIKTRTENDAVIEFAKRHVGAEIIDHCYGIGNDKQGGPLAIMPIGRSVTSLKALLDEYRTKPERRKGTVTLTTEQSFIHHASSFGGNDSVIFALRGAEPSLTAVYDYHPSGGDQRDAAFGEFRAKYTFPLSDEWLAWRANHEKPMDATAFATFLEDHLPEVIAVDENTETLASVRKYAETVGGTFASPSQLLDLSRSLEINASIAVKQAIRLQSGEISVQFSEIHNDNQGRPIKVPSLFVIAIPVFVDGAIYPIACRLRYRTQGQGVVWSYSMVHPARYIDDAVNESANRVADASGKPVFFGKPEK